MILSDDDRKDVKQVKAKLQSAGADGAVLLKLAGRKVRMFGHAGRGARSMRGLMTTTTVPAGT